MRHVGLLRWRIRMGRRVYGFLLSRVARCAVCRLGVRHISPARAGLLRCPAIPSAESRGVPKYSGPPLTHVAPRRGVAHSPSEDEPPNRAEGKRGVRKRSSIATPRRPASV